MYKVKVRSGTVCACGCGSLLPQKRYYGKMRVLYGEFPRFLTGHGSRTEKVRSLITGRPDVTTGWVEENQGQHVCQCGCGKEITIRAEHRSKGIPQYAIGHAPGDGPGSGARKVRGRTFSFSQRIQILVKAEFCCVACGWGGVEAAHLLEFDHIIPVSKGGKTTVKNGQALCRPCHLEKTHHKDCQKRSSRKDK